MTSICEKKFRQKYGLFMPNKCLYNFMVLRKEQQTQLKTEQLKQDILNQWESIGFSKLICSYNVTYAEFKTLQLYNFVKSDQNVTKLCARLFLHKIDKNMP